MLVVGDKVKALHFCSDNVLDGVLHVGKIIKQRFFNVMLRKFYDGEFREQVANDCLDFFVIKPLVEKRYQLPDA